MDTVLKKSRDKKKWRPPKPPNILTWHLMATLFLVAKFGWDVTDIVDPLVMYLIGIPFTFTDYWMRRRHYKSSIWNGRSVWLLALASTLSWYAYGLLIGIDLFREILGWWES